jgi:hypothetical protein
MNILNFTNLAFFWSALAADGSVMTASDSKREEDMGKKNVTMEEYTKLHEGQSV